MEEEEKKNQLPQPSLNKNKGPFKLVNTWSNLENYIHSVSLSCDSQKVAFPITDYFLIKNHISGDLICKAQLKASTTIRNVFFHPKDSNRLFCGTFSEGITEWDSTGVLIKSFEESPDDIHTLVSSPDGNRLASGSDCGPITLWNTDSGKQVWRCQEEKAQSICLAFSKDMMLLASGHNDHTVKLRLVSNGNLWKEPLKGHTGHVVSLDFSADGTRLASGGNSDDKTVRVWEVCSGKILRILNVNSGALCLKFFPDGKKIATGSQDKLLKVWDENSGYEIERLVGHEREIGCLEISKEGTEIISGANDFTIRFWQRSEGPEPEVPNKSFCSLI